MGLYERWTYTGDDDTQKIPVHVFAAAVRQLARGAATVQQLVAAFGLQADDLAGLQAVAARYAALPADQKPSALVKLHDVMILCEAGLYSKAQAKTELGF